MQLAEEVNELIAWLLAFYRIVRDGRMGSGTLTLVAETYDAHEGNKLGTMNMQTVRVIIAAVASSIAVADMYRNPGSMPARDLKLFHFCTAVVGL